MKTREIHIILSTVEESSEIKKSAEEEKMDTDTSEKKEDKIKKIVDDEMKEEVNLDSQRKGSENSINVTYSSHLCCLKYV